jgi:hypothetical protein
MDWDSFRRNSKGWRFDPIAKLHPKICFGNQDVPTYPCPSHVVNCATDEVSPYWFREWYPNKYACIGAIDSLDEDITSWYPKFEEVMNKFLNESDCRMIYVHCECGINRSAFLCLIYMCKKFGLSLSSVAKSILIQRPCAFTNPSFRKQVTEYI